MAAASAIHLSMEPRPSPDDAHLLRRIASGDGDALTRLFDEHSPVALGLLVRMLGARAEAEEVLQQAPLGTVKSRILLGMNKLRQALGTS